MERTDACNARGGNQVREELIDMEDISYSREVMQQKTHPGITVFIWITALLLLIGTIWSYFGEIDTYVNARGEVRPTQSGGTVTVGNGGKITNIAAEDGETVQKGDLLLELNIDSIKKQREIVENQINNKQSEIEKNKQLATSIKQDENIFDEDLDVAFYQKYENYRLHLQDTLDQVSTQNNQVKSSEKETEQVINQARTSLDNINNLINDYSQLYDAIENETSYNGENLTAKNIYDGYVSSLEKAQLAYNDASIAHDSLVNQKDRTSNPEIENQINQVLSAKNNASADINIVKNNVLTQINDTINTLKREQNSYKMTIDNNNLKNETLTYTDLDTTKSRVKNSYYTNINESIDTLKNEIEALEIQLVEINDAINKASIVAEQDGIVTYNQNYAVGDLISSGVNIASITPSTENYRVVIYIPEYDISEINIGQKLEYTFNSISVTDFGKVHGEVQKISADSFIDESNGQKYYRVIGSIDTNKLSDGNEETREIRPGMIAEVNAITGQQSIMSWMLDKLNFK